MTQQLQNIDPAEYWIIVAVVLALCLGAFYYTFRSWRRARIIEDVPTAKIRSAHQGYVELEGEGRLMGGTPIISPLSGQHCLWYHYKVERKETYYSNGKSHTRWQTVRHEVSDHLFYLEDGSGRCVVDPEGAEVTTDERRVWYGNAAWPDTRPPPPGTRRFFASGSYRYSEWTVRPLRELYVIGEFKSLSPLAGHSVAEITRDLLREWKQDRNALIERFDANGDGEIDMAEWERAREAAEEQARHEHGQRAGKPHIHVIAKPEAGGQPYLLSVYPQHHLSRRYRYQAFFSLVGFFATGIALVWLLQSAVQFL